MQRPFLLTSILSPGARPFVPIRDRVRRPIFTYSLWRKLRLVSPLTGRVNVDTIRRRLIDDHWSFSRVSVGDVRAKGVHARAADDSRRIALSLTTTECNHWCSGICPATRAALLSISLGSFHISMDRAGQSVSRQGGDSQFPRDPELAAAILDELFAYWLALGIDSVATPGARLSFRLSMDFKSVSGEVTPLRPVRVWTGFDVDNRWWVEAAHADSSTVLVDDP